MKNIGLLYLAIAIVSEVIGTTALKLSEGFTKPLFSTVVVVGYGLAFYLLSLSLKTLGVGFSYAVWAGAGIILIAVIGVLFFGEKIDTPGVVGMALIVVGVVILNFYSAMGKG
ncbi:MAG: multidrug efflux SMR transporter [Magnetococcales bacterium]|nr:multidrug efflux SMR transporter [Magnetococcales bacterium]